MENVKRIKRKHNDKNSLRNNNINFRINNELKEQVLKTCKEKNISISQLIEGSLLATLVFDNPLNKNNES